MLPALERVCYTLHVALTTKCMQFEMDYKGHSVLKGGDVQCELHALPK